MGKVTSLPKGKYTAKQLFADLHEDVHDGMIQDIIMMYRRKEEGYHLAFTHMSDQDIIFVLSMVKQELLNRSLYGDYDDTE